READQWRLVLADEVGNGQQLECRQRPENDIDPVALDQLLRLGLRAGRIAACVGRDEVDLAPRQAIALFLEQGGDALLHLDAALPQRSGLDGEQADLERSALRAQDGGRVDRGRAARRQSLQNGSALDGHWSSLPLMA